MTPDRGAGARQTLVESSQRDPRDSASPPQRLIGEQELVRAGPSAGTRRRSRSSSGGIADRLHAVVVRLVDHRHEAEDVTQEAFVRAWRSIGRFNGDAQFFTSLYRIGVNEAHRRSERSRRGVLRGIRSLDVESVDPADVSQAPERAAE